MKRIILASSSPRRIEMMNKNGYQPEIIPADIDESIHIDISCEAAAMAVAYKKAGHVLEMLNKDINAKQTDGNAGIIIIAADTIVVHGNKIIGKPHSEQEAFDILSELRNSSHHVMTGVAIIDTEMKLKHCFCDISTVYFNDYTDEELNAYIKTDEPYDKAGGYAIQGTFAKYIDRFSGDYDNIVGFPWYRIESYLTD